VNQKRLNRVSLFLPAAALATIGMAASVLFARLDIERRQSDERSRVVADLAPVRARLEGAIKATFSSTDGLVHLISLRGGIEPELFADMARLAIGKNGYIRNITLAPDDVVQQVYPLAGNERVIGFRFVDSPEQAHTVQLARERRESLLVGPVELVQGGMGLINRAPIFLSQGEEFASDRYWGTASIVAYLDSLLRAGDFPAAAGVRIALRGKDGKGSAGELIDGDMNVFDGAPVLMDVNVPGGRWQLGAIPADGWWQGQVFQSTYFWFGLAVSLFLVMFIGGRAVHARDVQQRNARLETEMNERLRVEMALREEEKRFRLLFDSSPDPAWIIESNRFVECNVAAARILGYESGAAMMFVHPAKLSPEFQPDGESSFTKAERMMALAVANGVHRFEWVHRRANGSEFPAEVTLSAFSLQGRQAIYCVWRDITARKEAEEDLRASRSLLAAIIDSAGAVIYVFDTAGRLLLCNRQFEKVVGTSRTAMLGKARREFMPEAVASEHERNDRQVIVTSQRTAFEEHTIGPNGVHHYLTVKCPIVDSGGINAVVGISTDITERKQNEERLKLAAAVLAATADGVMVTDVQARIVSVNRAFTEITGYSEDEVRGHKANMLKSDRHDAAFYQALWASLAQSDVWQGELWNRRKTGEIYPEWLTISAVRNDQGEVTHYVGVFSDISAIKRTQRALEHLAHFDPLTDLPNRVLFQDRLTQAMGHAQRHQCGIAVLVLDLDGFKTVNDSLGHPVGDHLLQAVALRLRECIRAEDTVARLGGDEFALILTNLRDGADAIEVVRKILGSVEKPFDLDGLVTMLSASIGIAVYPADGETPTELVRNADTAMYGAKEAGRNIYRFYQPTMTHRAQTKLHNAAALRRAIDRCEFEVWFQPQIALRSGRMTGSEALLRWRDPERGLVPPAEFIPLAERTGLIVAIGEQVLEQVVRYMQRWRKAGLGFGKVAVNVSAPQIERGDFVATLRRLLATEDLPPGCLEIEVTESLIMENAAHAREVLLAVQALGITTAVDDFGTGYSSLSYLKELPIDKLKIDRAFVGGLPDEQKDATITRTIIAMAHSLGFRVTAEGVETAAQRRFLEREGCEEAQGYLFSRPLPADAFEAWLSSRSRESAQ